jgi:L-fuconolactonase
MKIDSHQHFWRLERGDYNWLTPSLKAIYRDFGPADLAPILARHGIEGTVLVQAAASVAETDYMLSLAGSHEIVRGVVGWVDFESPAADAEIERLSKNPKLKGLRPMIHDIADPDWMLKPALRRAFAALQRCGLRFDALLKPPHLAAFVRFLDLYPDLAIVVDHGAKPEIARGRLKDWAPAMRRIAANPRVHAKMSGLVTEAAPDWQAKDLHPYLDLLVECFGPSRLMWGSDWPVVDLAGGYDRWYRASMDYLARLNTKDQDAILGGNAERFYGL